MTDLSPLYETLEKLRLTAEWPLLSDEEEACLRTAVDDGDPLAAFWLGWWMMHSERSENALLLLEKASQARIPAAIGSIATHKFWKESSRDSWPVSTEVLKGWQLAAERGDYEAQYMLATHGENAVPPLADDECRTWLIASAKAGFNDALICLGEHHAEGRIGSPDHEKGAALIRRAYLMKPSSHALAWLLVFHLKSSDECDETACQLIEQHLERSAFHWENFARVCENLATTYWTSPVFALPPEERIQRTVRWFAYATMVDESSGWSSSKVHSLLRVYCLKDARTQDTPLDSLIRRLLERHPSNVVQDAIHADDLERSYAMIS